MPGQKDPGGNAGCPAGTDPRPALISSQAGTFSILQFGFNIQGYVCHFCKIITYKYFGSGFVRQTKVVPPVSRSNEIILKSFFYFIMPLRGTRATSSYRFYFGVLSIGGRRSTNGVDRLISRN